MTMRTTALNTTAIVTVALAALAGCSAYPDAIPHPGAEVCAAATELFNGPAIAPIENDSLSQESVRGQQPRLSEAATTQLRQAVPTELNSDIDTLISTGVDAADAAEHLQEWAIRACGIEVAFADDGVTAAEQAIPNDIRISGEQETIISVTGDIDYALAACEAEITRGDVTDVTVLNEFGFAVVTWQGEGHCTEINDRP